MEQNKKVKTYNNAKVYRIICNVTGLQYIGSTCKTLSARLSGHKADYKGYLDKKQHYISSYKILENDNFDIVLLENLINCKSKDELHQRERYYIDIMECVNKFIPGRTIKQYYKIKAQDVIHCQCGCSYKGLTNKYQHEKTKKHINNMAKLE